MVFFSGLVAYLVGLGGDQVDELRAAVHHQLAGVVGHAHVGQRLLDHLVDGRAGDGQVVVVAGGGTPSLGVVAGGNFIRE